MNPAKGKKILVSTIVLKRSKDIKKYLNVRELLNCAVTPGLEFLRDDELKTIASLCDRGESYQYLADRVLIFLKTRESSRKEDDFRKFILSVNSAIEHRGHRELTKIFRRKIGEEEWQSILSFEDESESPEPSPYSTPCRSPALIVLQGTIAEDGFIHMETQLWLAFSKGQYDRLRGLINTVSENYREHDDDCQVIGMWFQALIKMHEDKDYTGAIQILDEALDLAHGSINETILVGRVRQRKAQVYLMDKKKRIGAKEFERAKYELQFVGRGYDKTNLFCREAKVLSATEPHRREHIENVYQKALTTLLSDDPYFLASYPSVILSKTAFHLHLAFGSRPGKKDSLPLVSPTDIKNAKATLQLISPDDHIFIEMRRLEYSLIQAELLRLEGEIDKAKETYEKLTSSSSGNIASIANHRLKYVSS